MILLLFSPGKKRINPVVPIVHWKFKDKVEQLGGGEIFTPDGQDILVGERENQVLRYEEGSTNWHLKVKLPTE